MERDKSKNPNSNRGTGQKLIATNPNAKRNYIILETVDAGMVLLGTEIKSLRNQSPNLKDAYVNLKSKGKKIEAFLVNTHIAPYENGNRWNHEPLRPRKILLHQNELQKLYGAVSKKGLTVVPTKMMFQRGFAKIQLGLGKGKKTHDKRDSEKQRSADREMSRAQKRDR